MSKSNEQQIEDLIDKHHDSDWRLKNPTALRKSLTAALDAKDRQHEEKIAEEASKLMRFTMDQTAFEDGLNVNGNLWYRRAPKGSILDDAGNVIRVNGKLPATKDGVVIVEPSEVWWWDGKVLLGGGAAMKMELMFCDPNDTDLMFSPNAGIGACYSTKDAASTARGDVGASKEEEK